MRKFVRKYRRTLRNMSNYLDMSYARRYSTLLTFSDILTSGLPFGRVCTACTRARMSTVPYDMSESSLSHVYFRVVCLGFVKWKRV